MYGQFLYFMVAVFLFAAYSGAEQTHFSPRVTLILFLFSWIMFIFLTRRKFTKIVKEAAHEPLCVLDRKHDAAVSRQTIAAIFFFAMDIYVFNLPDFLAKIFLLSKIPTLSAALCLGLFICRMAIVWTYSHILYSKIYPQSYGLFSTIASNLRLAAPVFLPWLTLSFIFDLLGLLPDNPVKIFLTSGIGEVICLLVFLFIIAVIGPFLIQKLWQCTSLEPGPLRDRIRRLCDTAGMAYKDILIWPIHGGKMMTAGVMGLIKNFRYILITPSLVRLLDAEEIDAVVAHEIGHIKKKHLLFYLLFFIGFMLISFFLLRIFSLASICLYYAGDLFGRLGVSPAQMAALLFNVLFIAGFLFYFRFVFGFFIRNFERQADAYVYTFFKSAAPLITTLEKIARAGHIPPEKPNWHHFSIRERILFLLECEKDRARMHRHDRTLKKGIAVYMIGFLALMGMEAGLTFSKTGKEINAAIVEKTMLGILEQSPDNPALHGELGDMHLARREYEKAVAAYDASLRMNPDNPAILNNLAWLLATCPDPRRRNPARALALAEKAADLETSPHIWDTLAECYYVNGLYEKAIFAGRKAMALSRENDAYYGHQLKKFESERRIKKSN